METELGQQLNNPRPEVEAGGFAASTGTKELGQQLNNPLPEVEAEGSGASTGTKRELGQQLINPQPELEPGGSAASIGTKRRGRKPSVPPDERRNKKIASDRSYRQKMKEKMIKMEEEMGSLRKIADFYTGTTAEHMEMRLRHHCHLCFDFHHGQSNHGEHSVNLNNQGSTGNSGMVRDDGIRDMSLAVETPYSDVLVTDFIAKLETDTKSYVDFSSFKDLDGERQRVGNYSFPISLVSTVNAIKEAHDDVTRNCLLGPSAVENTYILLCAAIKEMGDLPLKEVTEERILKWRDAIMDAKRIGFDVKFAWEHLKTIAYGFFGLKARNYRTSLEKKMTELMGEQKSLRQKLEKKEEELKAVNAIVEELTSSQCKMCLDCADGFLDKNVGLFG